MTREAVFPELKQITEHMIKKPNDKLDYHKFRRDSV